MVPDLKAVKSNALRRNISERYSYQGWYGDELRQQMKKALPNLKRLMLVSGLEDGRQIYAAPGHIEFDDKPYSSHGVDTFTDDRHDGFCTV